MIADSRFIFPDPRQAHGDCIAMGGDLSPETLLTAYRMGIFPWYSEYEPILWWSLDPRFVIYPSQIHIGKRLCRVIRRSGFRLSLDEDFHGVMLACRNMYRPDQEGTWISQDMIEAYLRLHELGYAHSVEAWIDGELVGGLYGVSLGGCFFGESMFHLVNDASKVAFAALAGLLTDAGFGLIDCQQHTGHLSSFGAVDISRMKFCDILQSELAKESFIGSWEIIFPDFPNSWLWMRICCR